MSLKDTLEKHWPPDRIKMQCRVCNSTLYDTVRDNERYSVPIFIVTSKMQMRAKEHKNKTGHNSFQADVEKPEPINEVDINLTVNVVNG